MKHGCVIVSGANTGIGLATVSALVAQGYAVIALSHRKREPALKIFERHNALKPGSVRDYYLDLTDTDKVKSLIRELRDLEIAGLVNNAAALPENRLFVMTPLQSFREIFEINFFAQINLTQLTVRLMLRDHSHQPRSIVNVSSISALDGEPGQCEYVTSKAALIGMTYKLARELSPVNIRVNAIAPGLTDTGMLSSLDPELKTAALQRSAGGRVLRPEEIARTVAYLISDASSGINGQVLEIRA